MLKLLISKMRTTCHDEQNVTFLQSFAAEIEGNLTFRLNGTSSRSFIKLSESSLLAKTFAGYCSQT